MTVRKIKVFVVLIILTAIYSTGLASSNGMKVKINDVDVRFNIYPRIADDKLLIPVRELFEFFGYKVIWNGTDRTALCTKDGKEVLFDVDKGEIRFDGRSEVLDSPFPIIEGRIFTPPRIIEQTLDVKVQWHEDESTVYFWDEENADISVSGSENIVAVGENIIVNITRRYRIEKVNEIIAEADRLYLDNNLVRAVDKYEEVLKHIPVLKIPKNTDML
ncbi:copper amine oxidase N-terminal domain-containing protein [Acetivibrio straminisolvens]|uniref:Copper amine oxidase-like N-terminal domain-containing protein n=1 Tax=Acetivibrio straminisolvens JCM 21531 TaxID=1294263 RepID=W4V3S9_9FIRM|nr:copper amine oxidase N-terminal domain-containing protein [Acetivibrio straminisolvens]GAE88110.1 hypothetical protein JCM21531_1534 [Acetivibrio straminisolvens JCM 21531]